MQRYIIILLLIIIISIVSGCGWHLRKYKHSPDQIKIIIFNPLKSNNYLNQVIRNQFYLNGIELIEKNIFNHKLPIFKLIKSNLSQNILTISEDGFVIEYQIVIAINAKLIIPNHTSYYPINTKISRLLINNKGKTPLIRNAEKQFLIKEMQDQAAEDLIKKLINIQK